MKQCVRWAAAVLLMMMLVCQAALAEGGTLILPESLKEVGAEAFAGASGFDSVVLPQGVTAIGSRAFADCSALKEIYIPDSVTEISSDTFDGCGPMMIYAPQDSTAAVFAQENGMGYVAAQDSSVMDDSLLPDGAGSIQPFAYIVTGEGLTIVSYLGDDEEVVVPAEIDGTPVLRIGRRAFAGSGVRSVTIESGIRIIDEEAFSGCVKLEKMILPDTLRGLKKQAFENCFMLSEIAIPRFVMYIEERAFMKCISLTRVEIADKTFTSIEDEAFIGCKNLKAIRIPESAWVFLGSNEGMEENGEETEYWSGAFAGCNDLTIYGVAGSQAHTFAECMGIPFKAIDQMPQEAEKANVACEGDYVYQIVDGCAEIRAYAGAEASLTTPETLGGYPVTVIRDDAFKNCDIESLTISEGVCEIGSNAFSGCRLLQRVKLPDDLTLLGAEAFLNCISLEEIEIPGSLKMIDECCFSGCSSLSRVVIGDGVEWINPLAFDQCSNLTAILIPSSVTLTADDDCIFAGCDALTIYGEEGSSAQAYAQAFGIPFAPADEMPQEVQPGGYFRVGDYLFRIENEEVCIERYFGNQRKIVTPAMYGGLPVTQIKAEAFAGRGTMLDVTISEGVREIGINAFKGCTGMTRLSLPDSLRIILDGAFEHCTGLTCVELPKGMKEIHGGAFKGCRFLYWIYIPESVTYIWMEPNYDSETGEIYSAESDVFEYTGVTIYGVYGSYAQTYADIMGIPFVISSDGIPVPEIPEDVFKYAVYNGSVMIQGYTGSLQQLEIPQELDGCPVTAIGDGAFQRNTVLRKLIIPQGVTRIGEYAFESSRALSEVELPEGLEHLGEAAFYGCRMLEEIELPGSLTRISNQSFSECSLLSRVVIGDGTRSIGEYAFAGCGNLTAILIPGSVTQIENDVFVGCDALTIYGEAGSAAQRYADEQGIPFAAMEEMPQEAAGTAVARAGDYLYRIEDGVATILHYAGSETDIVTPQVLGGCPVTEIGWCTYADHQQLRSVTVSEGIATIEYTAFSWCESLVSVSLPASLRTLSGFNDCKSLTYLHVPDGVTRIGGDAFCGCENLEGIYIPASVTSVAESYDAENEVWESGAFDGCDKLTIYGEAGSYIQKFASRHSIPFEAVSK